MSNHYTAEVALYFSLLLFNNTKNLVIYGTISQCHFSEEKYVNKPTYKEKNRDTICHSY